MIELRQYVDTAGRNPFRRWFDGLDADAAARVQKSLARVAAGNISNVKSVGNGVCEVKMDFGPGYRVYFGHDGAKIIILLGGGSKKRMQRDIGEAHARWADYLRRK